MKRKITVLVLGILIVLLSLLGQTYALWNLTKTQEKSNKVESACVDISFDDSESTSINLSNAFPLSEENGRRLKPYSFTVTNNCNENLSYRIDLGSDEVNNNKYISSNLVDIVLDDGLMRKYSDYKIVSSMENDVIENRALKYGTINANSRQTHKIVIFLDELASNISTDENYVDAEAGFNGKLTVQYGQITEMPYIMVASGDVDTLGSEVVIGTEHFYVLGDDENDSTKVKLFAKYNLLVGGVRDSGYLTKLISEVDVNDPDYNIQSPKTMSRTNGIVGTVKFSETNYWDSGGLKSKYGSNYPAFVYDDNSNVKQYVDNYKGILEETYRIHVEEARIISQEEMVNLGCDVSRSRCDSSPKWLTTSEYWTGSATSANGILGENGTNYSGSFISKWYYYYLGIRPIIVVQKDIFK